MAEDEPKSAPMFKKRAKTTFKRRHDSSDEDDESDQISSNISVAEILRQRKQSKTKKNAAVSSHALGDDTRDGALVASNNTESDVEKMKNRFVAQTGQVVGLYDKQMNDYIDAKMAEYRSQQAGATFTDQVDSNQNALWGQDRTTATTTEGPVKPDKLSVTAGKLLEVDLGGRSRHEEEAAQQAAKPVKVRLGRDGKPWRPRKRRGSEDLARDALIDSIMKENSLSRFQDAAPTTTLPGNAATPNTSEYVDEDKVFENFKSNYQDPERRNTRKPPTKDSKEQAKGPKMGGSKNARRAMAEAESAKAKKP